MEKENQEFFVNLSLEGIAALRESEKKAYFFEGKWYEHTGNNGNGNGNGKGGEEENK